MENVKLNTIEEAIEDFKAGNFVIVVDDEDRENEGDLIIAAEKITPEKVNFMLKHARGVLCAPITVSRCKELDLPHQVSDNTSVLGTPFTVLLINWKAVVPGFLRQTALLLSRRWPIRLLLRPLSGVLATLIHCMLRRKVCCAVPDIRRLLLIWHVWLDFIRREPLWK